jgi:hypothetical protein
MNVDGLKVATHEGDVSHVSQEVSQWKRTPVLAFRELATHATDVAPFPSQCARGNVLI